LLEQAALNGIREPVPLTIKRVNCQRTTDFPFCQLFPKWK